MKNFFYSLITFVIAFFFILLGIVCVMIPWSGDVRYYLIRLLLEDALALSIFGLCFIVVGAGLVAYIILNTRRKCYRLRCANAEVWVDEAAFAQHLSIYWKRLYPDHDIASRIFSKNDRIAISVELPSTPLEEQRELLKRIQKDLEQLFKSEIGYENDFYLTVSFIS